MRRWPERRARSTSASTTNGQRFWYAWTTKPMPVPAGELGLEAQALEQVERDLEPVGLLGIDVEADVVAARADREVLQHRIELAADAVDLRPAVARVQRRQLDRDARPGVDAAAGRGAADRVDGVFIGAPVARRVLRGQRRLAEHVVRVAESLRLARPRVGERLGDRLAGDELLAHQAHRPVDALSDQRLAALADEPRQRARQARLAVRRHQLAGEKQPPGRGVDEQRRAAAEVLVPLAGADLVADERVARRRIGDAQQRLGEAHQRHAFLRRQRVLLQQALDQAFATGRALAIAQRLREPARQRLRGGGGRRRQTRRGEERRHGLGLGAPVRGGDRGAQRRARRRQRREPLAETSSRRPRG